MFWNQKVWLLQFFLLVQNYFGYLGSLRIPYEFQDEIFHFCKKCHWNFVSNCNEYIDCFGSRHFYNIKSSNPLTWISICLCVWICIHTHNVYMHTHNVLYIITVLIMSLLSFMVPFLVSDFSHYVSYFPFYLHACKFLFGCQTLWILFFFFWSWLFSVFFLGLGGAHPWHIEVPRLGVKLEL